MARVYDVLRCTSCKSRLQNCRTENVLAFLFSQGWTEITCTFAKCGCCHAVYSSGWMFASNKASKGMSVVRPDQVELFQIVATPKKGSKTFIDVKTLMFIRIPQPSMPQ